MPKKDSVHLDKLQYRLGLKLNRTDAFDFCYCHFYELMDFTLLLDPEIVRCDASGKIHPITYQDKRTLVKLCRSYDAETETISLQKGGTKYSPRVPLRHCLKSLARTFDKHFDALLYLTHEEEKTNR